MTQEAILYYADHPADFVEDLLHVTPDKNQRAILDSVAKNQMTSVRSGHGVGKSAVESWLVIWFLCTRPFPKIPVEDPPEPLVQNVIEEAAFSGPRDACQGDEDPRGKGDVDIF